jgi:type VI secretion system secreted protein VgrG
MLLDSQAKSDLHSKGDFSIATDGNAAVTGKSDIKISSPAGSVTISSSGEITVKGTSITVDGTGSLTLKSSGVVQVSGSMIKLG